eukprot:1173913-Prorocentrum_minimum.AAC.3
MISHSHSHSGIHPAAHLAERPLRLGLGVLVPAAAVRGLVLPQRLVCDPRRRGVLERGRGLHLVSAQRMRANTFEKSANCEGWFFTHLPQAGLRRPRPPAPPSVGVRGERVPAGTLADLVRSEGGHWGLPGELPGGPACPLPLPHGRRQVSGALVGQPLQAGAALAPCFQKWTAVANSGVYCRPMLQLEPPGPLLQALREKVLRPLPSAPPIARRRPRPRRQHPRQLHQVHLSLPGKGNTPLTSPLVPPAPASPLRRAPPSSSAFSPLVLAAAGPGVSPGYPGPHGEPRAYGERHAAARRTSSHCRTAEAPAAESRPPGGARVPRNPPRPD